jgi:hypothetical protein
MSRPHFDFEYVKHWILGYKIFDSPLDKVETGHTPANGASSLSPEVSLQPVEKYVRSTFGINISPLRQNHTV